MILSISVGWSLNEGSLEGWRDIPKNSFDSAVRNCSLHLHLHQTKKVFNAEDDYEKVEKTPLYLVDDLAGLNRVRFAS